MTLYIFTNSHGDYAIVDFVERNNCIMYAYRKRMDGEVPKKYTFLRTIFNTFKDMERNIVGWKRIRMVYI